LNAKIYLIIILLASAQIYADPWGKDADLARKKGTVCVTEKKSCNIPFFNWIGKILITFHQEVISPADGPRSHFIPSSSQYTIDAIEAYGFFQGVSMGCDRLMRENDEPWVYRETLDPAGKLIKYDPVP
jgi:putative component of membrane protein insertase Oxa1/YidC/SpoIIIJ protein YidD